MLVKLDEKTIHNAQEAMIAKGETDAGLCTIIKTAKMLREEYDVTPLYILDLEDGSLAVYIAETWSRDKLH